MEISRRPEMAERELSNARAAIHEACVVLRQYKPERDTSGLWQHQIRKLRMAIGLCSNVRDTIMDNEAFRDLWER